MSLFPRVPIAVVQVSLLVAGLFWAGHARAESIINGDFETGNTGFSSGYTYLTPPSSENMAEARYTVWTDPIDVHSKWASIGDHTTGDGMMLIANGASNSNAVLWHQEVTLTAGAPYYFSAWATSVYHSYPANLIFEIGGASLGTLQLTATVSDWQQFTAAFTATASGTEPLVIRDLETAVVGNDFALDDISLTVVPEPTTFLLIWSSLGVFVLFGRSRVETRVSGVSPGH